MRILLTAEQSRLLDQNSQTKYGMSEDFLMDEAGLKIANEILFDFPNSQNIVLLVGPGNNGGDGLVIAAHLLEACKKITLTGQSYWALPFSRDSVNLRTSGTRLRLRSELDFRSHAIEAKPSEAGQLQITLICPQEGNSDLWKRKKKQLFDIAKSKQSSILWVGSEEIAYFVDKNNLQTWDLLIDAVFGTGLSRPFDSLWIQIFHFFNSKIKAKVAVDIPSGLDASSGFAVEGTLSVDRTYAAGFAKIGLVVGDGPSHCGKIKVLKLKYPEHEIKKIIPKIYFFGLQDAQRLLPASAKWNINKSNRGSLVVIAGSEGMEGAGALASLAAARMGAGYVKWARWPKQSLNQITLNPSILILKIDSELNFLTNSSSKKNSTSTMTGKAPSVLVIGPGLGITKENRQLIRNIYLKMQHLPVVVDADALHILKLENLFPVPDHWILTPHSGELSKLVDIPVAEINNNRFESLIVAQKKLGGTLLLKGYRSLVVNSSKQVFVIGSGGPVLAKAGCGDVLSGMIGGLLAQGFNSTTALLAGAYLHGRAGDLYVHQWKNDFGMIASDLIEIIPHMLRRIYAKNKK